MKWFLLLLFLATRAWAGVRIGSEALISPTTDQEYFSSGMNRQPASNSVQNLNPPVFGWPYYEDAALLGDSETVTYSQTRVFNFQLTTNGSFASPLVNLTVSNNFYNFFQPITNADGSTWTGTCSWRVRYLNSNASLAMGTNPVHTFTMPANAEIWDRSCFRDHAYLNSFSNVHPHIIVKSTNLAAYRAFIHGPNLADVIPAVGFATYTNTIQFLTNSLWTIDSATMTNNAFWVFVPDYIKDMGIAYWGVTNAWFTNDINAKTPTVGQVLTNWAINTEAQNYDRVEAYAGNIYGLEALPMAYDLFYHLMTADERSVLVRLMKNWASFYIFEDWYYTGSTTNLDRVYGGRDLVCKYPSIAKQGESHMRHDRAALITCLAALGEDQTFTYLLEWYLNYYIARFDPFNYSGEDPRVYGGISTILDFNRSFSPWVFANLTFFDKKLTNAPVYNQLADVVMFQTPTGFRMRVSPWGAVQNFDFFYTQIPWQYTAFAVFAAMQGRGDYYRQFVRSSDSTLGGGSIGEAINIQAICTPFYWPKPTATDRNTNSFIDPVRGWVSAMSGKPTDFDVYTNQIGFNFQARPTGTGRNSGGMFSDGQIEMWAYGACVTDSGAGRYETAALLCNGLFVDGIGVNNANPAIDFPIHARFTAYTNFNDGVYVQADLTHVFNLSNYIGGGVGNLQSAFNDPAPHNYLQASNARPYISSVKRSVLFPHNRYWVIYDSLQTTQAAMFQWKWNAWPTNCSTVDTNTMGFNYQNTNNFFLSNVTVYVQHVVNPGLMGVTQMVNTANPQGTNENCYAKMNPFTGENYAGTNDWLNPSIDEQHYWANTIWIYNKTPTTNWHFMSVVYPVKWGDAAPTITRIDDYTVKVIGSDGTTDTNTFNTNYQSAFTFMVDIGATPVPIQISKSSGNTKLSGKVRIQ